MPFTFSHPAAVLPFTHLPKRWISVTGLMIGSLAPDFEYFLRMKVESIYSHTWAGLFWFDLPLTIIVAFLYHLIVRDTLLDNLPAFLQKRLLIYKNFGWTKYFQRNFFIVTVSGIVGITTHILWDGFTHEKGQFVESFDVLKKTIAFGKNNILLYKLLQHASTVIGELIIVYVLLQLPQYKIAVKQKSILPFWFLIALIALAVIVIRLIVNFDYKTYGNIVVTAIASGMIGLILTAAFFPQKT